MHLFGYLGLLSSAYVRFLIIFLIILVALAWFHIILWTLYTTNNRNIVFNPFHLILQILNLVQKGFDLRLLLVLNLSKDVQLSRSPSTTEINFKIVFAQLVSISRKRDVSPLTGTC